jgi:peptide chain release factor subunit 1
LTVEAVRELTGVKGTDAPVTSCYLDVDGARWVRHQDYETQLASMIRQLKERPEAKSRSVLEDLKRIEDHVRKLNRSGVRGVAMFSCSSQGFWQAIELPVPVRSHLVTNHTAHVRQLESILDEYERFCVLLADRQRARLFVFELGQLKERSELYEALPRQEDKIGDADRGVKDHEHASEAARQHLRHTAAAAFSLYQERPFDHLIIGAPDELTHELEKEMHSYLRERIAARLGIAVNSNVADVRQAALDVEATIERRKEAALVKKLRDAVGEGNGGVAGLKATLKALVERRVDTLLISDGYEAPGWRCHACNYVGEKGRACPVCGTAMAQVDDVIEEAIEEAMAQKCRVELCKENADLDVMGQIGALLRF